MHSDNFFKGNRNNKEGNNMNFLDSGYCQEIGLGEEDNDKEVEANGNIFHKKDEVDDNDNSDNEGGENNRRKTFK